MKNVSCINANIYTFEPFLRQNNIKFDIKKDLGRYDFCFKNSIGMAFVITFYESTGFSNIKIHYGTFNIDQEGTEINMWIKEDNGKKLGEISVDSFTDLEAHWDTSIDLGFLVLK